MDVEIVYAGIEEIQPALYIFEADAAIMQDFAEGVPGDTVGDGKMQLVVIEVYLYGYPVGCAGFPGDVFEGVFDKGHENEGSNAEGIGRRYIFPYRYFDILVLAKFLQLDRIFKVVDLFVQGYLLIVAFV